MSKISELGLSVLPLIKDNIDKALCQEVDFIAPAEARSQAPSNDSTANALTLISKAVLQAIDVDKDGEKSEMKKNNEEIKNQYKLIGSTMIQGQDGFPIINNKPALLSNTFKKIMNKK